MFCSNCGQKIPDDARFCPACGSTVGQPARSVGADATKAEGVSTGWAGSGVSQADAAGWAAPGTPQAGTAAGWGAPGTPQAGWAAPETSQAYTGASMPGMGTPIAAPRKNRKPLVIGLIAASAVLAIAVVVVFLAMSAGTPIDAEHFPDDVFRAYVRSDLDANGDGKLSNGEIEAVVTLGTVDASTEEVIDAGLSNKGITDLTGIEVFTDLTSLVAVDNELTTLDLTKNTALQYIDVSHNESLTQVDLNENNGVTYIRTDDTCDVVGGNGSSKHIRSAKAYCSSAIYKSGEAKYVARLDHANAEANRYSAAGLNLSPLGGNQIIVYDGSIYGFDSAVSQENPKQCDFCRCKPDGSDKTVLASVIACDENFYLVGDTVLLNVYDASNKTYNVEKVPTAGGTSELWQDVQNIYGTDAGGHVYYRKHKDEMIYRAGVNLAGEEQCFKASAEDHGGQIAICPNGDILDDDPNAEEGTCTLFSAEGKRLWRVEDYSCNYAYMADDDYIYFIHSVQVERVKISDGTHETVYAIPGRYAQGYEYYLLAVSDGTVYYGQRGIENAYTLFTVSDSGKDAKTYSIEDSE